LKNPKKSPRLKIILGSFCLLAILSSGILFYSNSMEFKSDITTVIPQLDKTEQEKKQIMMELKTLKDSYDEIIIEKKIMSLDLIQERDKVVKLMSDLTEFKGGQEELVKYRGKVTSLHDKLKMIAVENQELKKENVSITKENVLIKEQRDNAEIGLKESQKKSEALQQDLVNTVEKSSKLAISETTVIAYKLKPSGEIVITEKANKVEGINISFVIAKNEIAKPIEKVYYIQVINSENTVLGTQNEGVHQYKSLTYSLAANVSYQKKMVRISENLLGNKFTKGTYYVNIYDKEELVDESSFILK